MSNHTAARRLLLLLPFAPRLDAAHGGGRVIGQLLARLTARHQVAVLYLRGEDEPPADPQLAARCALIEEVVRPAFLSSAAGRLGFRLRLLYGHLIGRPVWATEWATPAYHTRLRELLASWQPDLVQFEFHLMGQYLPALGAHPAPRLLTQYEPGWSAARERWRKLRGYAWARYAVDVLAWRRFEGRIMGKMHAVVAFTERDQQALAAEAPGARIVRIPFGTLPPERPSNPCGSDPLSLLFVGNFVHLPNVDAALRLVSSIFPLVQRRCPAARLLIVGDHAPPELLRAASDRVTVTGYVPNLEPYLDRAAVVVVPLQLGGGMRVKVQEALAAGKAIVASPLAVAGLGVVDGEQLLIAESDQQFADAVTGLLADPARRVALAARARDWACANLDWERSIQAYEQLYAELLGESCAQELVVT